MQSFSPASGRLGEDATKIGEWKAAVGAHFVATSLADAVAVCVDEARDATNEVGTEPLHVRTVTPEPAISGVG